MTEKQTTINVFEDERVQEILQGLAKGYTREELAAEFGHKNYKTLDMYMRRRNFEWDSEKGIYKKAMTKEETAVVDTSKANRIIQLIDQQDDINLQRIAQLTGFESYKALASYMASNHYTWSNELNNYEKQVVIEVEEVNKSQQLNKVTSNSMTTESSSELAEYLPILKMLKNNEVKLLQLLQPYGTGGQIPRYTIPGVAKTKTVQMIHSLDQMVTDFAKEKNMTQRDVFEVALINFFKQYGYERQVEVLLR